MTAIDGRLYAAGSSGQAAARMRILDDGQVVVCTVGAASESEMSPCQFDELSISSRLGNTPRLIDLPDGRQFETGDNDAVDRLLRQFNRNTRSRLLHALESRISLVLTILVAVSILVWGFVRFGVPAIATVTAEAMPAQVVGYLGTGTLEILDETWFQPSALPTERKRELLARFGNYTAAYPDLNINVDFRAGGRIGANALALPDGYIIFTDELVELAQHDLELVAILGHEIGHLAHRHLLRRVIQSSMLTAVLVMISGDISSASSIVYALPALLLELSYSREFEREADQFAYRFLTEQGISTQYFADIMRRLMGSEPDQAAHDHEREAGPGQYFSTHPDTLTRIRKFEVEATPQ